MMAFNGLIARLFMGALALSSACWAVIILSRPNHELQLDDIASRIMSGDGFHLKSMPASEQLLKFVETRAFCSPIEMRAATIIRLRLIEDAINDSDTALADQRLSSLRFSVDRALGCVPTEGFLWFVRYWGALHTGQAASEHFDELRMSYLLAPFEGWIALRRSPYTLAIYDGLPADIQEMALNELVAIFASGFIGEGVKILEGPGWPVRDLLLPRLEKVRIDIRRRLDRTLRDEGHPLIIPGVEAREFRPLR